jgi:hypothetical protein
MMKVSSRFQMTVVASRFQRLVDVVGCSYAPHSGICSKRCLSRMQPNGARGAPYTLVGER